ncbi:MAG: hypothetical protein MUP11_14080, partial [Anaerolineales bacterium]|nr:hypothetical protein [Anaerolineales bacterium]
GIVLGLKYSSEEIDYGTFLKKRILHIYPIYYLILIAGILLFLGRTHYGFGSRGDLSFLDIPLALTGTYAFLGRWGGPFIGTSWFLGIIMSLYLVFPWLVGWIEKKPYLTLFILFIVSVSSRYLLGKVSILPLRSHDWFLLCRIFEFGLGITLAKRLPEKFWDIFNVHKSVDHIITYLGELSFPMFLVHWPIFHTLKHLRAYGVPAPVWLSIFMILSIETSIILLAIDKQILSPYISRYLNKGNLQPING